MVHMESNLVLRPYLGILSSLDNQHSRTRHCPCKPLLNFPLSIASTDIHSSSAQRSQAPVLSLHTFSHPFSSIVLPNLLIPASLNVSPSPQSPLLQTSLKTNLPFSKLILRTHPSNSALPSPTPTKTKTSFPNQPPSSAAIPAKCFPYPTFQLRLHPPPRNLTRVSLRAAIADTDVVGVYTTRSAPAGGRVSAHSSRREGMQGAAMDRQ